MVVDNGGLIRATINHAMGTSSGDGERCTVQNIISIGEEIELTTLGMTTEDKPLVSTR